MTARALISGSPARVESLGKRFAAADVEPVTPARLEHDGGSVEYYVQLGVMVPARGDTIVRRVKSFLDDGLLERFTLAESVLPRLADGAVVLLVAGNTAAEVSAPDDRVARLSLLRVLAHAMRADAAPKRIRVRVIASDRTDDEIAGFALTGAKDPDVGTRTDGLDPEQTYANWRIQVLGMAQVEM